MNLLSKIKGRYKVVATSDALYHGTNKDFKELQPNEHGIIWLTNDPEAAKRYARRSPNQWLFSVKIAPKKTVDLRDPNDPVTALYKKQHEMDSMRGMDYKIPDAKWKSGNYGGYHLLEKYGIELLTENHVDVAIALDASGAYDHLSYAVVNPKCITILKRINIPPQ